MAPNLDLSNLPDADVVALAQRGREPAFRELVRRYERPVFSLIVRMVHDSATAEDLAQDTFIKVLNHIDKYRPEFKLSSWLFKIANNVAIDHLRRRQIDTVSMSGSPHAGTISEIEATSFEIASGDEGVTEVGNFCKLTCEPSSPHLHQYFVELMAATASMHSGLLIQQTTDEVVGALVDLFRELSLPGERSITGLWGELLLIHLASSPGDFVDAWHLRATDSFDFAFSECRIEVKTTERPSREHDFSLKQVRSGRLDDLVVSVTVSRSSAGLSALDLARCIAERLSAAQQAKLWRLVITALGEDAEADDEQRFDMTSASDALTIVRAADIPAPDISASAAPYVTDVRFRSNINILCATSALEKTRILSRSASGIRWQH